MMGYPTGGEPGHFKPYGDLAPEKSQRTIDPVPKEWTDNAATPWRILFPDLDWTPPDRDL